MSDQIYTAAVKQEREHIAEVISAAIGWAADKDAERLYWAVVNDERLFIFHPDAHSTIHGFAAFKRMIENTFLKPSFRATGFEIKHLEIQMSASGTVAWYTCLLDDRSEWNGVPSAWIDVRWTGVLEKFGSQWKIMQMHFSKAEAEK